MTSFTLDRAHTLDPPVDASIDRLLQSDYEPRTVLADGVHGDWPGDYPGRLILALAQLSHLSARVEPRLAELLALLPEHLNDRGYLGPVHEGFDEQQLAGNAWLVSGLYACARRTGATAPVAMAERIIQSLYLPLIGRVASYPPVNAHRDDAGAASGNIADTTGLWSLSSDTYCIFIALEALVAAYAHDRDERVNELILELFDLIDRDDLVDTHAQLHASLTAARCAAVHARLTGDGRGLEIARRLYDLYCRHGRTLNDATMNWFGRPDSWTEPCAMVDAQLLARELWRATGDRRYLDDTLLVEANALGHAQKPGGGYGLDSVATEDDPTLRTEVDDAAWCCTMRGAVGLVDARLGSLRTVEDDHLGSMDMPTIEIESPHSADISWSWRGARARVQVEMSHTDVEISPADVEFSPADASASPTDVGAEAARELILTAVSAPSGSVRVVLALPSWLTDDRAGHPASEDGREELVIVLAEGERRRTLLPRPRWQSSVDTIDGELVRYFRGADLLGRDAALGPEAPDDAGERDLRPIACTLLLTPDAAHTERTRIAFRRERRRAPVGLGRSDLSSSAADRRP